MVVGDPDGDSTGEFVIYLVGSLPHWQPPAPENRKAIPGRMVPVLKEAKANGKSLRELAQEVGVSHETIRVAVKST